MRERQGRNVRLEALATHHYDALHALLASIETIGDYLGWLKA